MAASKQRFARNPDHRVIGGNWDIRTHSRGTRYPLGDAWGHISGWDRERIHGLLQVQERSFYLQQTADAIESEWEAVELSVGHY